MPLRRSHSIETEANRVECCTAKVTVIFMTVTFVL